ncbi:MAG TPA: hypothetical protein VGO78_24705, partial [Acidimicrobiales bacterium]|nr:hypothetical protein [Acidimicrobiales bacterium]
MLGRRGLVADYIAALRGTMAMRRERGQVLIELTFAVAAMTVAFVGLYTIGIKGQDAESADAGRAALGLPVGDDLTDPDSIVIGDDTPVPDDEQAETTDPGSTDGGPNATGSAGAPGTTGSAGTPATGVLPSETGPGATPPRGSVPGGQGGGGTSTSVLPTSTTTPGPSTSDPGQPSTSTPTTTP